MKKILARFKHLKLINKSIAPRLQLRHLRMDIALRTYVRTLFKGSINAISKGIKLIPSLSHPIL
jgi:hypothetical protein